MATHTLSHLGLGPVPLFKHPLGGLAKCLQHGRPLVFGRNLGRLLAVQEVLCLKDKRLKSIACLRERREGERSGVRDGKWRGGKGGKWRGGRGEEWKGGRGGKVSWRVKRCTGVA